MPNSKYADVISSRARIAKITHVLLITLPVSHCVSGPIIHKWVVFWFQFVYVFVHGKTVCVCVCVCVLVLKNFCVCVCVCVFV